MATISFLYRSKKEKSTLNLRLLFRHDNKDYVIGGKTKFEVSKFYWVKQHKKKSKDINITNRQTEVNNELNKIERYLLNAFNSISPNEASKEWLKTQIDYYYHPPKKTDALPKEIIKYFDVFLKKKSSILKQQTKKNYNVVKQQIIKYQESLKQPILIKNINEDFKLGFEKFCNDNGYSKNTIAKGLATILTICKDAKYNGLETSYQLEKIKAKYVTVDKVYLTLEEIEKIKKIDKSKLIESYENARDWLIISCFTGQRISDFMRFSHEQIRIENGKHLIEFTQKKTGKIMTVPLHSEVLQILNKRKGKFPRPISDQKYNDYIKKICQLAKLNNLEKGSKIKEIKPKSGIYRKVSGMYPKWELVTSHIGRRSFATNFYGKIPTTYLTYVTGHSTEKMFLNYIGKSNKDIALELTKYF